jgi:hypothetical protein
MAVEALPAVGELAGRDTQRSRRSPLTIRNGGQIPCEKVDHWVEFFLNRDNIHVAKLRTASYTSEFSKNINI